MREIDLCLATRRHLEPHLEAGLCGGPDLARGIFDPGVSAGVAQLADLRSSRVPVSSDMQRRESLPRLGRSDRFPAQ
jgi:hypothetical protein